MQWAVERFHIRPGGVGCLIGTVAILLTTIASQEEDVRLGGIDFSSGVSRRHLDTVHAPSLLAYFMRGTTSHRRIPAQPYGSAAEHRASAGEDELAAAASRPEPLHQCQSSSDAAL